MHNNSVEKVGVPQPAFGQAATSIFDGAFDFYGTLSPDGEVVTVSGSIFARTGLDPILLKGQKFADTVFWQSDKITAVTLRNLIGGAAAGNSSRSVVEFRVNAEEKIAMDLFVHPLPADGSNAAVFIGGRALPKPVKVDSTPRKTEQMLVAADIAGIGLWYWSFNSDCIYSTPTCNDLLNVPAGAALTYEGFRTAVHPEDRAAVDEFIRESQEYGRPFTEEFRVVYADGSIETLLCEGRSYADSGEKPDRMLGVLRKITQEKKAAFELSQVYEREKRSRDEAVEANRAKDFFLAFVSHELRSPLNAILGWSKILLTKQVDDETRLNALQTIEKSARLQTKLIDDLVDSARVASGKLRLEYRPTNLYEIVNAAFQAHTPAAAAQNIALTFTSDSDRVVVHGDAGRLQQIFANLLSNAVKFTPDGGSVSIDLTTAGDRAVVSISDSGQGIEPDALPGIFKQFSQGDITQGRRNPGLGLGLSIVNILVEKHGGTVRAESPGRDLGSTFTVTFPISRFGASIDEESRPAGRTTPRPLSGIKILIVEDDNDSREVLQLFLEQCGAEARSTESAKSAMQLLGDVQNLPDVIISDLAMPDEDGYTFVSKVRGLSPQSGGAIPAIALSAFATAESKKRALESGFTRYATKPFEPDVLINEIIGITGRASDSSGRN